VNISVTDFKCRCLEIIRRAEETGKPVNITRHGKVVARLSPAVAAVKPWLQLRSLGGRLLAEPDESAFHDGRSSHRR